MQGDPLKINRADWKRLLAGGFAFEAAGFAVHPLDEERARATVFSALHAKVSLPEILAAAREYLKRQRCLDEWIEEQVKKVERFVKSVKLAETKRKAWVITWEGSCISDRSPSDRIIAVHDSRIGAETVEKFVGMHYVASTCSLAEKVHYSSHRDDNPYPVRYLHTEGGDIWLAGMHCGHDPYIFARIVSDFRLVSTEKGTIAQWKELKFKESVKPAPAVALDAAHGP